MKKPIHAALVISLLFLVGWMDPLHDHVRNGNESWNQKEYDEALKEYENAEDYATRDDARQKLSLNRGDAYYGRGEFDRAIEEWSSALESNDSEVRKKAHLNRGNAYAQKGEARRAAQEYIEALSIDPGYEKAKKNLEYLLRQQQNEKKQNKENSSGRQASDNSKQDDASKEKNDEKSSPQQKPSARQDNANEESDGAARNVSPQQWRQLMDSMKDQPVRRMKNSEGGVRSREKDW